MYKLLKADNQDRWHIVDNRDNIGPLCEMHYEEGGDCLKEIIARIGFDYKNIRPYRYSGNCNKVLIFKNNNVIGCING